MPRSLIVLLCLVLPLIAACGDDVDRGSAPAAGPSKREPVVLGRFTFDRGSLDLDPVPQYRTSARYGARKRIVLWVGSNRGSRTGRRSYLEPEIGCPAPQVRKFNVPGAGEVECSVTIRTGFPIAQREPTGPPTHKAAIERHFLWQRESSSLALSTIGPVAEALVSEEPDRGAWYRRLQDKSVAAADQDPALELIAALAREPVVFSSRWIATGLPFLRASVDGGESLPLLRGPRRRGPTTWILPARPGSAVTLEVAAKYRRYVATIDGVRVDLNPTGSPGDLVIQDRRYPINSSGRVKKKLKRIETPQRIDFTLPRFESTSRQFRGSLLLRFGRPEEQWLDRLEFPLAPPPDPVTIETGIRAIEADLAAAFDPDRGYHLHRRGKEEEAHAGSCWARGARLEPNGEWARFEGKGGFGEVTDARTRAVLIVKLHLGYLLTGMIEYAVRRDALFDVLRAQGQECGVIGDSSVVVRERRRPDPMEMLALVGQLAAFLEDEAALRKAQERILAMLARQTGWGRSAYAAYEDATFEQRHELRAVLKGVCALPVER